MVVTICSTCYGNTKWRANTHQATKYSYSHMEGHSKFQARRELKVEFKTFWKRNSKNVGLGVWIWKWRDHTTQFTSCKIFQLNKLMLKVNCSCNFWTLFWIFIYLLYLFVQCRMQIICKQFSTQSHV